jgi:hypothetical protein
LKLILKKKGHRCPEYLASEPSESVVIMSGDRWVIVD